ncbi:putative cysteine and histidine-rich domain-containing protein 1 [Apostichopus japonicus]|uniref:Putative cysteine and histidine-rich domain-containing protein 1 n=1 Tax=Stichopus japonicus TaxID=307972 RepID=A0A2G8L9R3_STIJA|nr:putative cysteine and histidine-rich domain-containing protein 1 [Apostichopus japonicus]
MRCYNKGCAVEYSEDSNGPESCVHHPGEPVFHDAYKGWSCCKKRTTDFTEFLNIPGCKKSHHNPDKPAEVPKEEVNADNDKDHEEVIVEAPRQPNPKQKEVRPRTTVGQSLKTALSKLDLGKPSDEDGQTQQSTVTIGTSCKNTSCGKTYQGEQSNRERCAYHSGSAVFHEGMKYWSCCKIKTSDFDNFMAQPGCETGDHRWIETEQEKAQKVACRYDWHQTSGFAVLSIYCKNTRPENTVVRANPVRLSVDICFDNGKNRFQKSFTLEGVVYPEKSSVQLLGTKTEIKLKKAEPLSWKRYEV